VGIVQIVLKALIFLPAGLWLGGLVMLAVATRVIEKALKGRRTEGRQIVRQLRAVCQRVELVILIVLWAASIAHLLLATLLAGTYPGTWGTANGIGLGLLVVPTIVAAFSTFYLTGAIKKREAQLGSYADKNEQIRVRKGIALLGRQAEMLTWLKAVLVAGMVVAAVLALG